MKKHCAVFIAVVFCSYFFMGGGCRKSVDPGAGSDPADMLPADITGVAVWNPAAGEFRWPFLPAEVLGSSGKWPRWYREILALPVW